MFAVDIALERANALVLVGFWAGTFLSTYCPASAAEGGPSAHLLEGGVEHSESLAPLSPDLKVGIKYGDELLSQPRANASANGDWYKIPAWFAGTWETKTKVVNYVYDYKTKREYRPEKLITNHWSGKRGAQMDRLGQIWEYNDAPSKTRVESDKVFNVVVINRYEPLKVSEKQVRRRKLSTSVVVEKETGLVKELFESEIFQDTFINKDGTATTYTSIKKFDSEGKPVILQKDTALSRKTADFSPVKFLNGEDLCILFKAFLKAKDLRHLEPDN